jgi:hypothetical protein
VDAAIAFYGKPFQTIVAIRSLLQHSGQHIDKIYLADERQQPHGDTSGIYRVISYFRKRGVSLMVHRPRYFLPPNPGDVERARTEAAYRHSIMYQYALEHTDKPYLVVLHNDMLFHGDMIGDMLNAFANKPAKLAGTGAIGQCWSCPASHAWAGLCSSETMRQYVPNQAEALLLHQTHDTPRRGLDIEIIADGRVHPLPECRLNEYCAMLDVSIYRAETLPVGNIGCYGGGWQGADLGTTWFYQMFHQGYQFKHFVLEKYVKHAPFDDSGSGSVAYSRQERYWAAEAQARQYLAKLDGTEPTISPEVALQMRFDKSKRGAWWLLIHTVGWLRKQVGR